MPELRYPQPPLKDGTLALREPVERDSAEVSAACQDPLIVRYTQVPAGYTEDHARNWFEISAQQRRRGTALPFLVVKYPAANCLEIRELRRNVVVR